MIRCPPARDGIARRCDESRKLPVDSLTLGLAAPQCLQKQCPLRIKLGPRAASSLGPLVPRQPTCRDCGGMPVWCQQAIWHFGRLAQPRREIDFLQSLVGGVLPATLAPRF